jgi:hypothetical protein
MIHEGGCHCGNLRLVLHLSRPPREVTLRACGCSFCRAHATRTTSDPLGEVDIWAQDWNLVEPYRFGSRSADFLVCRRCGVYIGAVGTTEGGSWMVINTNSLTDRALFTGSAAPVDHGGEATEDRMARRITNWTPAILHRENV